MLTLSKIKHVKKWIPILEKTEKSLDEKGEEIIELVPSGIEIGLTNATHKRILEMKIDEGPYLKALNVFRMKVLTYQEKLNELNLSDIDKEVQSKMIEEYQSLKLDDTDCLTPVYHFIDEHIIGIKGIEIENEDGSKTPINKWSELDEEYRELILDSLKLEEINTIYAELNSLSALDPNV